jgi:hypothetical protein
MARDPVTAERLVTRHVEDNWERIVGVVRRRETAMPS